MVLEEDQWGRGQGSLHHSITRGQSHNSSVDGSRVPQYCQAYFGDTAYSRVQKSPHKFMLTSYMKYFAKFLAILPHNTSYLKIYIICNSICYFIFSNFNVLLLSLSQIVRSYCSDAGWLVCGGEDIQIFHYFWLHFGQI